MLNSFEEDDALVGPAGISGYAPWATWLEILLIFGGVTGGVVFVAWLSNYRKRKMARPQS